MWRRVQKDFSTTFSRPLSLKLLRRRRPFITDENFPFCHSAGFLSDARHPDHPPSPAAWLPDAVRTLGPVGGEGIKEFPIPGLN